MMQISEPIFKTSKSSQGFTLIEVLIALTLLAFISILIYEATVRSFDINKKLTSEAGDMMGMAVALQVMDDDFSQIFHPVFPQPKTPQVTPGDNTPTLFWSRPARADGIRRTRLLGTKEKVSFITNGNLRVQSNAAESDLLAVVWEISKNKSGTYALTRSSDVNVFNYGLTATSPAPGKFFTVVDNLTSAGFSYYRKEGDRWEDAWDSEGTTVKDGARYPDLISIKLEGPDPTNPAKPMEWRAVFRTNIKINTKTDTKDNNALPPRP